VYDCAGFFRGTSTGQDSRFGDPDKKLMAKMSFPKNFATKVGAGKPFATFALLPFGWMEGEHGEGEQGVDGQVGF
jgi:hypothetical protein